MIQLFEDLSTLLSYASKLKNLKGEDFNLFAILGAEYDEVKTHSAILVDLLDPQGSHGQGDLYLKLYIEDLGLHDFETSDAVVYKEYFVANKGFPDSGRIDILIQDKNLNRIVIENKIYAAEHKDQLTRYRNAFPKATIVYLTLDGEEHDKADINQSYHTDILRWLERCRKESIDMPVIREAIGQYIYLIKKLTDQHIDSVMDKQIQNRILRDEDSLSNFLGLTNYFSEVKNQIHIQFYNTLRDHLDNKFYLYEYSEDKIDITEEHKDLGFFFCNDVLKAKNICIGFQFDGKNKNRFYCGILYYDEDEKDKFSYNWLLKKTEQLGIDLNPSGDWLHWEYIEPLKNWSDDDVLLKMFNGKALDIISQKVDFLMSLVD